jgi:hypothetical protein
LADVDSPIALEFLDPYPTPQSAAALGEKRMAAFMARHAYCGRRSAVELLERLRGAPVGVAGELEVEANGECVRALVAVLRPLVAQIAMLTAAAEYAVEAHADGKVVTSLLRSARACAAMLLAELGDDRARFGLPSVVSAARRRMSHAQRKLIARCLPDSRVTDATSPSAARWSPTPRATPARGPEASTKVARPRVRARPRHPHPRPAPGAYDPAKHRAARQLTPHTRLVDQEAA